MTNAYDDRWTVNGKVRVLLRQNGTLLAVSQTRLVCPGQDEYCREWRLPDGIRVALRDRRELVLGCNGRVFQGRPSEFFLLGEDTCNFWRRWDLRCLKIWRPQDESSDANERILFAAACRGSDAHNDTRVGYFRTQQNEWIELGRQLNGFKCRALAGIVFPDPVLLNYVTPIVGGKNGVLWYDRGNKRWKPLGPELRADVKDLAVYNDGEIDALYAATDKGLYRYSHDGAEWIRLHRGVFTKLVLEREDYQCNDCGHDLLVAFGNQRLVVYNGEDCQTEHRWRNELHVFGATFHRLGLIMAYALEEDPKETKVAVVTY